MKRRNGTGRFQREDISGQDINPMDGLANLADIMLVFACGLMLALITYWNVDVAVTDTSVQDTEVRQEVTEDLSGMGDENGEVMDSENLQQYGTVFIDPETGKLYMTTESGQ